MRLVLDNLQAEQAKKELKRVEDVLPRVARECYRWLLCPSQDSPLDNELVIATWSPIHLTTSRDRANIVLPSTPPGIERFPVRKTLWIRSSTGNNCESEKHCKQSN